MTHRRLPAAVLIAGIAGSLMQCDTGQLFQPTSDTGILTVSPTSLADSVAEGSIALRAISVNVGASGPTAVPWQAAIRRQSKWLSLGSSSGMAPGTLTASADPQGLGAGTYRDTIALTRSDMPAGQVLIPVTFQIQPCAVAPIALDGEWTDSLRESSCGAPHRAGSFGQLFGFSAAAGDSVSVELITDGFDGFIVLDSALAAAPLAVAEGCEDEGRSCLRYQLLPRTGPYVIEVTSSAAGASGRFTLRATRPRAPPPPLELGQFREDASTALTVGEEIHEARVIFAGVVTDDDAGDSLRLEIEVKLIDHPFDGSVSATSEAETASGRAVGRLDLADGDYHWRARARDHTGRTSPWTAYGGNAAGSADVRVAVQQAPALEGLEQATLESAAIQIGGLARAETVVFRGLVTDGNAEDRGRLEVELRPVNQPFTNIATATSGLVTNGTVASVSISGLEDSVSYHWQARSVDEHGKPGSWGAFGANAEWNADFAVALPPTGLVFLDQPSTATAGVLVAPFRIAAVDAAGRTLRSFGGAVSVALQSQSEAALSGSATVVAVAGVATFSNLRIELMGEQYVFTASAAGVPSLTSMTFGVSPAPASRLVFSSAPISLTAGELLPAIQIRAVDAFGNTATGFDGEVTVTLGPSGVVEGTTTIAASAGVAQFTDLTVELAGQGYTLTARATGIADAVSPSFSVSPGNVTQLAFTTAPGSTTAGGVFAVQLTAQDGFGNTATGFSGAISLALAPSGTLAGTATVSAVDGIAIFTDLTIVQAATGYALTASALGIPNVLSPSFTVSSTTATQLVFTTPPVSTTAGATIPVQLTARDAFGNTATGFTGQVTLTLEPSGSLGGTTTVGAAGGIATFADLNIQQAGAGYAITASASGIPNVVSSIFTINPGAAAQLAFTTPPASTSAGSTIPVQLTARDAFGNTAVSFTGQIALTLGPSGTLGGTTSVSAAGGIAMFADLSIQQAAAGYVLTASASGIPDVVSQLFTVNAGSATQLAFTTTPASATAGAAIPLQVSARDAFDNTATSFTGQVTVTLGPSGELGGTTTVNAVGGIATFADLTIEQAGTGYALSATAAGLTNAVSSSFSVIPGFASQLVFTRIPTFTTAGDSLLVEVDALDAFGNPATGFSGVVTLSIAPAGVTLGGTTTAPAVAGQATFADLSIAQAGAGYTLTASASGLENAVSPSFTVHPSSAAKLVFTIPPGSRTAGAVIPIELRAVDDLDNVVTGFTEPVTVALGPTGTLAGTTTVVPVAGVATFSDLHVDVSGVRYSIAASAAGVASVISSEFSVSAGVAVHVTLSPQWVAVIPGDSVRVTAGAVDEFGNAVPGPIGWEVENAATASVDPAGWVRGVAHGSTRVIARSGAASATARAIVAPPQLVGAGDIASCSRSADEATAALLDSIPGIIFTSGDNAYPDGSAADFAECYAPSWGRHLERTRPAPGNHDYDSPNAAPYYAFFGAQAGDSGKGYYSLNFAGWHVISLNSEISMSAGTPQEQWLRADLAAHPAMCTVAFWHHPLFSSGRHGNISRSRAAWRALMDAGAELVIASHDHTYERFAPQSSTADPDPVNGLRQFVVGTGGADLYEFSKREPNSEVSDATSHGVLVLTLRASGYDWRFVPVAGDTFTDSGSGDCH